MCMGSSGAGSWGLLLMWCGKEKWQFLCVFPLMALIMSALRGSTRVLGSRLVLNNNLMHN